MRYVIFVMLSGASAGKDLMTQMQLYSWEGVIITAYDLIMITRNSIWRFNLIVEPEHRV